MKLDINLIPSKNKDASYDLTNMMLLVLIFSAIVVVIGYVYPQKKKIDMSNKVNAYKRELEELSHVSDEYNAVIAERDVLKDEVNLYTRIKSSKVPMSKIFKDIENSTPKGIQIKEIKYGFPKIEIKGKTATYKEVSQMLLNLRNLDYIEKSTFNKGDVITDGDNKYYASDIWYDFELTVELNLSTVDLEEIIEELKEVEEQNNQDVETNNAENTNGGGE